MNNLKKLKMHKIIEICVCIILLVFTYSIWNFDTFQTAAYYTENSLIQIIPDSNYPSIVYPKNVSIPNYNLILSNTTYRHESYKLYLKVPKTVDTKSLYIEFNEPILLDILKSFEDENYSYYLLDKNTLVGENKEYHFKLWDSLSNELKSFNYEFYLEKI